ncbi:hypothetical protein ACGF1Z_12370 [Streptomyces sp. NPDC048018]|uniref:hypothetical protein n=1 Tax=Streptomyces sp. NPDC048018 TaxID=3365499 RepID=UPI00371BDF8F
MSPFPPFPARGVHHPDDESLPAGGVLAQHHALGTRTAVVTATWPVDSRRAPELGDAPGVLVTGAPRLLGYGDARDPESAADRTRLMDDCSTRRPAPGDPHRITV